MYNIVYNSVQICEMHQKNPQQILHCLYDEPRIILLIGICIKRMKNPINPINRNPIDVAIANFLNSE